MRKSVVLSVLLLLLPVAAHALDSTPTPATSALKMTLGLLVVLAVMALLAWLVRRFSPGNRQHHSVARVIGGVSVGTRERVVVVEVAGRWIVVGVAPGHVSALANLDADETLLGQAVPDTSPPFAGWLQRASEKFNAK